MTSLQKVTVRYKGPLRDSLRIEEELVDITDQPFTLRDLFVVLHERGGVWAEQFGNANSLRAAIDGKMSKPSTSISPINQVTIFLPIAGG